MRVLICGAAGKMGQEVLKAVTQREGMQVVALVDTVQAQANAELWYPSLQEGLAGAKPDVVVDFTTPNVVMKHLRICLEKRVPAVVGTTGLSEIDLEPLRKAAAQTGWPAIVAPNFAIGAVLMMKFAAEAARFFPQAEIIEYHHEQKKDAPSGTAVKTAEMIAATGSNRCADAGWEKIPGARGAHFAGVNVHSVRLPGFVAHQEVIFGLPGQNLVIRHDATHRESFMPGVILAIERVVDLDGIVYGLEHILFS